jgi:hypothetical protein
MRQRKSYEKDSFTTVIESLSTTTTTSSSESTSDDDEDKRNVESDAPFPRDEAHVTILSEIEKRLTKFPPSKNLISTVGLRSLGMMGASTDGALVLYRSPESMGLPKLERQKEEEMKAEMRRRIMEKRRGINIRVDQPPAVVVGRRATGGELDGYEADAEDLEDEDEGRSMKRHIIPNGHVAVAAAAIPVAVVEDMDDYDDDGEMMDLD